MCLQGLRLDANGQPAALPQLPTRDAAVDEQLTWAGQSDKKANEFMSNVHLKGGQAFSKAGGCQCPLVLQTSEAPLRLLQDPSPALPGPASSHVQSLVWLCECNSCCSRGLAELRCGVACRCSSQVCGAPGPQAGQECSRRHRPQARPLPQGPRQRLRPGRAGSI